MNNYYTSNNNSIFLSDPTSVPSSIDPANETNEEKKLRYHKLVKLSRAVRLKLSVPETSQKIQAIGQKYGFELLRLANITRLIREYYFGEVRLEDFPKEIEKRMSVSLLTAQEISRFIKSEIIDWNPWAEYIAGLPKISVREIVEKHPKIADTEITAGYIELRNSDDLSDPTIKNWLQDYISHLGYENHSQMDRTQYLFHSENTKNLSSQDREKLGILLKSFDENVPLPVDEENEEIVFDGLVNEPASSAGKQESFIKPYAPMQPPQRPTPPPRPANSPVQTAPQNFVKPNPTPRPQKATRPPVEFATQNGPNPEIDKFFNAPDVPGIPSIKIHSITEKNEQRGASEAPPQPNIQRPPTIAPQNQAPRTASPAKNEQASASHPKHRIIDPFGPRIAEPRLDGNIVDLSGE